MTVTQPISLEHMKARVTKDAAGERFILLEADAYLALYRLAIADRAFDLAGRELDTFDRSDPRGIPALKQYQAAELELIEARKAFEYPAVAS